MARLPDSLAITLWIVGACWLLALLALLFGFDAEVIWAALLFGVVAGLFEGLARRRNRPRGSDPMAYLIVFLGAGIGGSLRHFVNVLAMRFGEPTYVGTAFINITGSLLIGLVVEYFALKSHLPRRWLLFITTGIMGGYTTFSTFSLETVLLVERSQYLTAAAYVLGSFVLSLGATFSAFWILRSLLGGH